jgi:hypothetical protein
VAFLQGCYRIAALAAGLAALAVVPMPAQATTRVVTTCADSGAGSLRADVAAAASGDTIDRWNHCGLKRGADCGRCAHCAMAAPVHHFPFRPDSIIGMTP